MSQHSQSSRASHSAKKPAASSRSSQVSVFASSRPLAPTSARGGIEAREDEGPSRKRAKVIAERHSSVDDDETQLEEDESLELFAGSDSLGDEAPPNSDLTSLSSFHFISFHFVLIFFSFSFFFFAVCPRLYQHGPEPTGCQKRRGVGEALKDLDQADGLTTRSNKVGEAKSGKEAEVEADQKPLSLFSPNR